ncbi:MAG TPA: ABC transporter permease subunit [Candidatus Dormibacteraeota bacterium]|nr:ABC transporter permease subunit [Candidatus Dormibacteraeota bacterium]
MTFLPIVGRELRVASRKRVTYWIRLGAALAVIIIGTWVFLMMQREPADEIGKVLFGILTGSALLYALLSGVRDTADCVSWEKREGTLGLLFLTDLRGYDVVLGKMVAGSLNAFYSVLAVLPMLAVPLLMGGVTLGEFGRTALVALNTMFFSLTLGLCLSSMSNSGKKAAVSTLLLIFVFSALIPGAGAWYLYLRDKPFEPMVLITSPVANYVFAWEALYKSYQHVFWTSFGVVHGLAWFFLLVASVIAPRAWQDRPAGVRKLRWRERWQLWSHGNLEERHSFRKRLLDQNAFYWLAARARLKPAMAWGGLGLLGCGWAFGLSKFHRDWLTPVVYIGTAVVLSITLKAWVATESGRQIAEDRKRGALELLLSTPLTVRDILRGQLLALRRHFLGPLTLVLCVGCLFMYLSMRDASDDDTRIATRIFWIGGMVTLVADIVALYWVGMWVGLTAKNPNRAAGGNAGRVLVIPGAAWSLVILVMVLASMRGGHEPSGNIFLGLWFGFGLAADIGLSLWARHRLLTDFRAAATQRPGSGAGFFRRLFLGSEPRAEALPPPVAQPE